MHLEIRHLRLVAAIADAGGVTRAGTKLFLTQSALSHQLKDIEGRLGAPLFLRTARRMVLTPEGERVLAAARLVLGELEQTEADVAAAKASGPAGVLRISTECYTCYHWLPAVLGRFRRRWPRVEVRIVPEATGRPLPALQSGDLDLAISSHAVDAEPPLGGARLEHEPLFDDELMAILAPTHPLAHRTHLRASDFAHQDVFLYKIKDDENMFLHEVLRPAGVRPAHLARMELTEAIFEMVKAGLGVSVLPRWTVAPHLRTGSLAAVRVTASGLHRRWSVFARAGVLRREHVRDFVSHLRTHAFPVKRDQAQQVIPITEAPRRRASAR